MVSKEEQVLNLNVSNLTPSSLTNQQRAQKVELEPPRAFGCCQDVRNNLHFLDEQTILFTSGNNCIMYNIQQRQTKFIPSSILCQQGPQGLHSIQAMAYSPDQRYVAVSECGEQATITIYDLCSKHCSKKQMLTHDSTDVICMAFSADCQYLLGQSGGPSWTLICWKWETNEVIGLGKTTNTGVVNQVSFNPQDNTEICVSGNYVFKIFKLENNSLKQISSFKVDKENIMCHAWTPEGNIVSGTESGNLLMLKAGYWHKLGKPTERITENQDPDLTSSPTDVQQSITAITAIPKGFACTVGPGLVYLYEKLEDFGYNMTGAIRIPHDPCSDQLSRSAQQEITAMCLGPSEDMLAISTRQGQKYVVNLSSARSSQANFEILFHRVHSGSITGLSTCSSKTLFATSSKDKSVRIWNYTTNSLELYKEFPEEPNCISLHPNGLSILVGFSDKICHMEVLADEFNTVQEFDIRNCTECMFNHDGNMFAAVSDSLITICNTKTSEKLDLSGHSDKVQSVKWSKDDRRLVSCGIDGTIYIWNTLTGEYESVKTQKSCTFANAVFSHTTGSILAIGSDFTLNEFLDGQTLKEITSCGVPYTAISMTHSSQAVFIGTATGTVRVIQYPFEVTQVWTEHQAHSGPITKMVVTPDDQYLLTASEDGSLLIWTIIHQEGSKLSAVKETCSEKEHTEQKLKEANEVYSKNMEEISQNFLQHIKTLEDQIQVLTVEKEEQKAAQMAQTAEMERAMRKMEQRARELKDQERIHKEMVINQVRKYEELEKSYERKMRELDSDCYTVMLDMKRTCDKRVQEQDKVVQNREERLKDLQKKAESEFKDVFLEYDQTIQKEKKTNEQLQHEIKLMEKQMMHFWKIKRQVKDQCLVISKLQDTVEQMNDNCKESVNDLKQRMKRQEEELCTERDKVGSIKTLVLKIKTDIENCSRFINNPAQLRLNFKRLYQDYVSEADVKRTVKAEALEEHTRQNEQLKGTVVSQKRSEATDQHADCTHYSILLGVVTTPELRQKQDDEHKHNDMCSQYKQQLEAEKVSNRNLQCEMKLMEEQMEQYWRIKREMWHQSLEIELLKEELQNLQDQHGKVKKVRAVTKKEKIKPIYDKSFDVQSIMKMHEESRNQNEDDLVSIITQLNELTAEQPKSLTSANLKQLQNIFGKIKQMFLKFQVDAEQMESIENLKEELKIKEENLCVERQKVTNLKALVQRMKTDIQNCSSFIQQPRMLKQNFIKIYTDYIKDADIRSIPI